MAGEIIRLGDRTSHDGTVIEGSQTDICMGKPIAYIGHKVHCPKCKGDYPIVEGVMTATFYGKGVAVAGMKTSCGAVLIAGQFTDIVEAAGGGASTQNSAAAAQGAQLAIVALVPANKQSNSGESGGQEQHAQASTGYDLDFIVTDEKSGAVMVDWPYVIELADGRRVEGRTDQSGKTAKVSAESADKAVLRVFALEYPPINPNWDR